MDDLMEHTIQDLYSAETQALEAMPQMLDRIQDQNLRQAFEVHQRETQTQVTRLEQIAQQLGIDPQGDTCVGMQGIIEEGQDMLAQISNNQLVDAVIIGSAQKMEHYEIAGYGTARTLALQAGQLQIADLLQQTLVEEKAADKKLTMLAESHVNQKAVNS